MFYYEMAEIACTVKVNFHGEKHTFPDSKCSGSISFFTFPSSDFCLEFLLYELSVYDQIMYLTAIGNYLNME